MLTCGCGRLLARIALLDESDLDALAGGRLHGSVLQGNHKTTTVTALLRTDGLCAVNLADDATNDCRFRAYVTYTLAPVLRHCDTVILGNLWAHKVAGDVRQSRRRERNFFTSRATHPTELVFAKHKRLLQTSAARIVPDLWTATRQTLARLTVHECRACFAAGYADDVAIAT